MIISFFILSLTGMALKFSYTGWAQNVSFVLGGFENMGFLHRLGAVTLVDSERERRFDSGTRFAATELGAFRLPQPEAGIPPQVLHHAQATLARLDRRKAAKLTPPPEVMALVSRRTLARQQQDWATADSLRAQIESEGWQVRDTTEGAVLEPC